jgi:C4-dicarboxylate-specific signal transduction histidine kinase
LSAILTNAQAAQRFLAQDHADPKDIREILSDIVADDQRAAGIIQRLRELFKRGETQRQPLDVNDLVRDALRLVQDELAGRAWTSVRSWPMISRRPAAIACSCSSSW